MITGRPRATDGTSLVGFLSLFREKIIYLTWVHSSVKYSGRLSSSETPFDQSDSFLFTLPKTGPVAEEPSLPPFFQTAAKKLKKTEIGQLMIAKELLQGKSFLNLPADLADDVIYEVEMLKVC